MIISFIAIPGSGKSTQIDKLIDSDRLKDIISISIPSLYNRRRFNIMQYLTEQEKEVINDVKAESTLSRKQGFLAPIVLDEIMFRLALRLNGMGKTVVIDGGPRGVSQAELFLKMIGQDNLEMYKIVELYFENNESEQSRDRQYVRTVSNKNLSIADAISKIIKIPNKISVYLNDTRPGVRYMEKRGIKVGRFEATDTVENIHSGILDFLLS